MKKGALLKFLKNERLDNSLMLGFYGGGNYGDELLMEVLANLMKQQGAKEVCIAYQQPQNYQKYHHDFGFKRVNIHARWAMLKSVLKAKKLLVGGGGLWGMDCNVNVLLMSLMLFISRWVLGKKVYLLAVGYYDSAPVIGRVSAWLAGRAANMVLARDQESFRNFSRINHQTQLDTDIAWHIKHLDLTPYQDDLAQFEKLVHIEGSALFLTLRRFHGSGKHHLAAIVGDCLAQNTDKQIILALLEPKHIDPEGYHLLEAWRQTYQNVQILDFSFNPLALFLFFQKYHNRLIFIGPQFHGILSAHLAGVPYLPLAYDNKVQNLLRDIAPNVATLNVHNLKTQQVQRFIDQAYERVPLLSLPT